MIRKLTENATLITNYDEVDPIVEKYRAQQKRIVLTQGSFDMIHIGHGRYCQEAKQHGDVLFVGVDSDQKIRTRKGPDRPVVPQEERMEMLSYLRSVDHVVLKELGKPKWELIRRIKPDVLIATAQTYSEAQIKELQKYCGKVVVLEPMATTSTSAKIRLVQLGAVNKIGSTLSDKLIATIENVLSELKEQK
ncbi:MAG: adenylyltransferase/cytidyltransferase family protein [Microgenomates group bacterium]